MAARRTSAAEQRERLAPRLLAAHNAAIAAAHARRRHIDERLTAVAWLVMLSGSL